MCAQWSLWHPLFTTLTVMSWAFIIAAVAQKSWVTDNNIDFMECFRSPEKKCRSVNINDETLEKVKVQATLSYAFGIISIILVGLVSVGSIVNLFKGYPKTLIALIITLLLGGVSAISSAALFVDTMKLLESTNFTAGLYMLFLGGILATLTTVAGVFSWRAHRAPSEDFNYQRDPL